MRDSDDEETWKAETNANDIRKDLATRSQLWLLIGRISKPRFILPFWSLNI